MTKERKGNKLRLNYFSKKRGYADVLLQLGCRLFNNQYSKELAKDDPLQPEYFRVENKIANY